VVAQTLNFTKMQYRDFFIHD